ncbi:MAG: G3E family GTPase [Motiliproteus sp.]|jgi:G3E family GTPase
MPVAAGLLPSLSEFHLPSLKLIQNSGIDHPMQIKKNKILSVPTNIITGFLGVGKTSAILHLLKHKPKGERWAVLVNEFGEIGVDGSLLEGQHTEERDIFIREVPGGCMCCAAGLPIQIAINQLLIRTNPDRLLIEPTGLGHPVEVLQMLSSEHYREVLSIQKIVTLVDARKISDTDYTEHPTFNQQIAIADIVVGNKEDLYEDGDKEKLESYTQTHCAADVRVAFTQQGMLDLDDLQGKTQAVVSSDHHQHQDQIGNISQSEAPVPENGYIKAVNQGEGFESIGWRFGSSCIFNHAKLVVFLSSVVAIRMKGVFITAVGVFGYNLTSDALTEVELDDCLDSRIEIISANLDDTLNEQWEATLLTCIEKGSQAFIN